MRGPQQEDNCRRACPRVESSWWKRGTGASPRVLIPLPNQAVWPLCHPSPHNIGPCWRPSLCCEMLGDLPCGISAGPSQAWPHCAHISSFNTDPLPTALRPSTHSSECSMQGGSALATPRHGPHSTSPRADVKGWPGETLASSVNPKPKAISTPKATSIPKHPVPQG